jgi:hypothetical protein
MPPNQRNATGFQRGHPRYGGRQKGTRNKLGGDVRQEILDGIRDVGFAKKDKDGNPIVGEGGIRGFVRWLGLHEPKTAAALLARVLPYFVEAPPQDKKERYLTEEQALAELKEAGLPLGLIDHLRRVEASEIDPDDIQPYPDPEVESEMVDVTPQQAVE